MSHGDLQQCWICIWITGVVLVQNSHGFLNQNLQLLLHDLNIFYPKFHTNKITRFTFDSQHEQTTNCTRHIANDFRWVRSISQWVGQLVFSLIQKTSIPHLLFDATLHLRCKKPSQVPVEIDWKYSWPLVAKEKHIANCAYRLCTWSCLGGVLFAYWRMTFK